nr:antigen-presenting glycoprotein CD1d2-like [Anolis sagrei ordinatus]
MSCRCFLIILFCGVRAVSIPLPVGPHALQIFQTVAFYSADVVDIYNVGVFLGDVQAIVFDSQTWKIRFLQPWARSCLMSQEWELLEKIFKYYFTGFKQTVNKLVLDLHRSYPLVVQSLVFCEIESDETKRCFYDGAVDGEGIVVFSANNATWVAQMDDEWILYIQDFLNKDKGTSTILQRLLLNTFVKAVKIALLTGNVTVYKQDKPVAVVFAQEPPETTDSLLLVCRVTGFYPHLINVSWLQDEVALPSSRINSTTILPNYDLTYQIRSSLAIKSTETSHSYACRIQHSSLDGKSLIIPWGKSSKATAVVIGLILALLAAIAAAVYCRWKKRQHYEDISQAQRPI